MDYEKLYKAALDRAKEIKKKIMYSNLSTESCKAVSEYIDTIIPELCENDNERIRKELINQIEKSGHHPADKARWISWLEKQKEQHPSSRFRPGDWVVYDGPLGRAILQVKDVVDGRYTFVDNVSTLLVDDSDEFLRPLTPEDVEKKAECLKAERDYWYVCIKDFYAGGKKQCSVGDLVQAKGGMYMMGMEDISEWFRRAYYEDVRDAFGPNTDTNIPEQKPELPLMDGDTDLYFDDLRMTTKPLTSREWFNEGIKYAQRLQEEQKPAEWSEEE